MIIFAICIIIRKFLISVINSLMIGKTENQNGGDYHKSKWSSPCDCERRL